MNLKNSVLSADSARDTMVLLSFFMQIPTLPTVFLGHTVLSGIQYQASINYELRTMSHKLTVMSYYI